MTEFLSLIAHSLTKSPDRSVSIDNITEDQLITSLKSRKNPSRCESSPTNNKMKAEMIMSNHHYYNNKIND